MRGVIYCQKVDILIVSRFGAGQNAEKRKRECDDRENERNKSLWTFDVACDIVEATLGRGIHHLQETLVRIDEGGNRG